jgi:hypothetical protein
MKSENMFWFQNHFVTRKVEDFEIYIPVWRTCDGILMTSGVCNRDKSCGTITAFNTSFSSDEVSCN